MLETFVVFGSICPVFNHILCTGGSKGAYWSCVFRSSGHQPVCVQRPVPSQTLPCRSSALNKFQSKLLEMETGTLNEGLSRTQLTKDRLNVALSVLLTKEV